MLYFGLDAGSVDSQYLEIDRVFGLKLGNIHKTLSVEYEVVVEYIDSTSILLDLINFASCPICSMMYSYILEINLSIMYFT